MIKIIILVIGILIYLLGYLLCYRYDRRLTIKRFKKWTVSDRSTSLQYAILSWIGLYAAYQVELNDRRIANDKPAKW